MVAMDVNLSVREAKQVLEENIQSAGLSVECIDAVYQCAANEEGSVYMAVFDKYYMRNSSRASLTVLITDVSGTTNVRAVGSGGSQGTILNFDWGASGNFEQAVSQIFRAYRS